MVLCLECKIATQSRTSCVREDGDSSDRSFLFSIRAAAAVCWHRSAIDKHGLCLRNKTISQLQQAGHKTPESN